MTIEDLYREYSLPLYRFLRRLTGSEADAEELLQETFYQALIHVDRFEGRSSPYTWLCTIGKNCHYARSKRCRREVSFEDFSPETFDRKTSVISAEDYFIRYDEETQLRLMVEQLPEPYRDIVLLHIYGEISLREIASTHGKGESWGRVVWYRARKMLREMLESNDDE